MGCFVFFFFFNALFVCCYFQIHLGLILVSGVGRQYEMIFFSPRGFASRGYISSLGQRRGDSVNKLLCPGELLAAG